MRLLCQAKKNASIFVLLTQVHGLKNIHRRSQVVALFMPCV